MRSRKIKVIRRALAPDHEAVETVMVRKSIQDIEAEAVSAKGK